MRQNDRYQHDIISSLKRELTAILQSRMSILVGGMKIIHVVDAPNDCANRDLDIGD